MNTSDIIALARAGFTAEQIAAIAQAPETPAPEVPAQAPAPEVPAQAPAQGVPDNSAGFQAILDKLGALTTAIQLSAIMASTQPKEQTADDIIAAIIAPPNINKEE